MQAPVAKMASSGPRDVGVGRPGSADGEARRRGRGRSRRSRRSACGGLVHLGDQIHRWNRLKRQLNLRSDEEMAQRLMDAFLKIHVTPSPPSEAVLQVCIREEGVMTQGAIRKEQDAVRSVIPFWPSAAVSTETRLTLPSATWKKDDPGESKPGGKRSRSDRLVRPRSSSSPDLPRAALDSERNWLAGRRVPLARLPLPLEEATPGRLRRGAPQPRSRVYIGDQAARWSRVKADLALPSDEEVARVLLDVFIEKRMHQPGPSHTVQETDLDVGADVSRDSAKEDNEQVDLDSVPSLSAGSESTVTLSHPSSIGSMEDETDISLFSGAGSTSDSVSKYPLGESSPRAKAEPAKREPDSEGLGYGHHHGSKDRHPETESTETDRVVPSETLPEGPERQRSSDGDITRICVGENDGTACPAVKIEREDPCSLPSPTASTGSDSTVTLSHPSSDISFEEECNTETAMVSESDTEGLQTAVTRQRTQMASPARNCWCQQPGMLDIGKQIERWNSLKQHLQLKSDEEMARALLDVRFGTARCFHPGILGTGGAGPVRARVPGSEPGASSSHLGRVPDV